VLFFAGDAEAEASAEVEVDAEVFFVVEVFLAVVDLPWVDVPWVVVAPVDIVVSSFFCDWQPRKAASVSAVIKDKTGVFIGLVKLNYGRECRSQPYRASTKMTGFFLSNL
jgi:hypothetical protein